MCFVGGTTLKFILAVLFAHWLGDFVFQTDWQARNKAKNFDALGMHVLYYFFTLAVFCTGIWGIDGLAFAGTNAFVHLVVDSITSQFTSRLYAEQRIHEFFVVVGLDQLIHMSTFVLLAHFWGWL